MKIGLGLYRHMLTREYYDFARQAGCTHVVIHLVDYFRQGSSNPANNQPTGAKYEPWGVAGDPEKLWTVDEIKNIRKEIEDAGVTLAAIENLDPAHWHDILLDGPKRAQQIEKVKTIIRHIGGAGVPVLGYNFSLGGVCGRVTAAAGRGRSEEHTSELQSHVKLVCRLLLEKKKRAQRTDGHQDRQAGPRRSRERCSSS